MATEKQQRNNQLEAIGQDILAGWQARYAALSAALPQPEQAVAGMLPAYRGLLGDLHRIQAGWMGSLAAVETLCDPQLPWHWLDGWGMVAAETVSAGNPEVPGKMTAGPKPILSHQSPSSSKPVQQVSQTQPQHVGFEWPHAALPPLDQELNRETGNFSSEYQKTNLGLLDSNDHSQKQFLTPPTHSGLGKTPEEETIPIQPGLQSRGVVQPSLTPEKLSWEQKSQSLRESSSHQEIAFPVSQQGMPKALEPASPTQPEGKPFSFPAAPAEEAGTPQNISFRGLADFAASAQNLSAATQPLPAPQQQAFEHPVALPPQAQQPVQVTRPLPPSAVERPAFDQVPALDDLQGMSERLLHASLPGPERPRSRPRPFAQPSLHSQPQARVSPEAFPEAAEQPPHAHAPLQETPAPPAAQAPGTPPVWQRTPLHIPAPLSTDERLPQFPADEFQMEDMLDQLVAQLQRDFQRIYGS
jgi:hypothetical protein